MVYSPHCLSKIETIAFDFITLNARFVDYFPRITQSIKGINKKAWENMHNNYYDLKGYCFPKVGIFDLI